MCSQITLLYTWNQHNTVNQLHFNLKKRRKQGIQALSTFLLSTCLKHGVLNLFGLFFRLRLVLIVALESVLCLCSWVLPPGRLSLAIPKCAKNFTRRAPSEMLLLPCNPPFSLQTVCLESFIFQFHQVLFGHLSHCAYVFPTAPEDPWGLHPFCPSLCIPPSLQCLQT